jgi:hypothetical protein
MTNPQDEKPVDLEDVPDEEGIDPADAAGRLEDDPEAQPNFTEQQLRSDVDPDDS